MSEIPSKPDWAEMERSKLNVVIQKCAEHWGQVKIFSCPFSIIFLSPACRLLPGLTLQVGKYLSGACNLAFEDMKKANNIIMDKDSRISELEQQMATVESSRDAKEPELKKRLELEKEGEKVRADNVEKESENLKAEVAQLKEQLVEQDKIGVDVIAKYKASETYQEIANVEAPEVLRCWLIAERHIKTDPLASWDSFIEEFLAVKDKIEKGLGEPVPYNGPTPAFLPTLDDQDP